MSWRRFSVLLRCMSPNSALVTHISSTHEFGSRGKGQKPNVVEGPKAAQSAFVSLFGMYAQPESKAPDPGR